MNDDHNSLLQALSHSTDALQGCIETFPAGHATSRRGGDAFCLAEHVCHLRDLENEGFGLRLRRVLTEELPALDDLNGATMAIERCYASQQVGPAWRDFLRQRTLNLALLRAQLPQHAQRQGRFGADRIVTLASLAASMLAHDRDHLHELKALRTALTQGADHAAAVQTSRSTASA